MSIQGGRNDADDGKSGASAVPYGPEKVSNTNVLLTKPASYEAGLIVSTVVDDVVEVRRIELLSEDSDL